MPFVFESNLNTLTGNRPLQLVIINMVVCGQGIGNGVVPTVHDSKLSRYQEAINSSGVCLYEAGQSQCSKLVTL